MQLNSTDKLVQFLSVINAKKGIIYKVVRLSLKNKDSNWVRRTDKFFGAQKL